LNSDLVQEILTRDSVCVLCIYEHALDNDKPLRPSAEIHHCFVKSQRYRSKHKKKGVDCKENLVGVCSEHHYIRATDTRKAKEWFWFYMTWLGYDMDAWAIEMELTETLKGDLNE
jgi:hypothetical protein